MASDCGLVYTHVNQCVHKACKSTRLQCLKGAGYEHTASIWTGSAWEYVRHGTKRCRDCGARYKLNFLSESGSKMNTLQEKDINLDTIVLMYTELGFRYRALKLHWNRVMRSALSSQAEAATIILTYPEERFGDDGRRQLLIDKGTGAEKKSLPD